MQNDGVGRRNLAGLLHALSDEIVFAKRLAAAMQPEVQPEAILSAECVGRGKHQTVRLHSLVESGTVAAHDQSGLRRPRGLACQKLGGSFAARLQQILGSLDIMGREELVVSEGCLHGSVKDLDVRQQILHARLGHRFELSDLRGQSR